MHMSKMYQKTDYPKIFAKTYWGNFVAEENPQLLHRVAARNEFVRRFNITKHYETPHSIAVPFYRHCRSYGDHFEAYLTETKQIVLLFSEHPARGTFEEFPFYRGIGYEPSDLQLYAEDQVTYIACFPCLAAFKQYVFAFKLEERITLVTRDCSYYEWRTPQPDTRQLWSPHTTKYYPYQLGPGYTSAKVSETLLLPRECFISHCGVRIPKVQRYY